MSNRREFITLLGGAPAFSALSANSRLVRAQAYPIQPVHLLVGFAPGGFTDITARLIGPWLSDRLRQQFLVENRPGASSHIATAAGGRAAPGRYTVLAGADADAFNATLIRQLRFHFIRASVRVASIDRAPFVMAVNPSSPANTVAEFIAYAKANTGKFNMGASGPGSSSQLYGELFKTMTGIEMAAVQYRGVGSALP